MPVVTFLNVIRGQVALCQRGLGDAARIAGPRDFGTAVQTTHEDATTAVQGIAQAYQSSSTEQMSSGWAELSARHVTELVDGSKILADALEAAAAYVVAQKAVAIVELVTMAAALVADQAAAVATFGLAWRQQCPRSCGAGRALRACADGLHWSRTLEQYTSSGRSSRPPLSRCSRR